MPVAVGGAWKHVAMADESGWTSPSGRSEPDEPPRYGERVAGWTPPTPAPLASAAATAPSAPAAYSPAAYAPPPRRGLIPLHPLSFGQLLGAAFGVIRWNPRATVLPALLVSVVQSGLTLLLLGLFAFSAVDRIQRASSSDRDAVIAGTIAGGSLGTLFLLAVTVFGSALLQGVLVTVVARGVLGERPPVGRAFRAGSRRILPLVGFAALLGVLQLVAVVVLVLLVVGVASAGTVGVVLAVVLGVIGGLGLLVAYAFLAVKLAAVPSIIVLERSGIFASIGRSWELMRGAFWRSFGLILLVTVMVSAAAQIVTVPFSVIGGAAGGLLFPNAGQGGAGLSDSVVPLLLTSLPGTVVAAVVAGIGQVAQVSAVVLVYLDRRMRREGLDLELQRHTEQGGSDPFERVG